MRLQMSLAVQCASGLYFHRPRLSARSISSGAARVGPCSRRMPVIHASAPSRARSSAATLAAEQQLSGPLQGAPGLLASNTSICTPKRSSNARHVAIVSSNSTPVSIVTTRTARPVPWSRRTSSSSSTDSSFWTEHSSTAPSRWRGGSRSVCVGPSARSTGGLGGCVALLFTGAILLPFLCTICLYGALALAPFDLERRAAVPVDELVHRL